MNVNRKTPLNLFGNMKLCLKRREAAPYTPPEYLHYGFWRSLRIAVRYRREWRAFQRMNYSLQLPF